MEDRNEVINTHHASWAFKQYLISAVSCSTGEEKPLQSDDVLQQHLNLKLNELLAVANVYRIKVWTPLYINAETDDRHY